MRILPIQPHTPEWEKARDEHNTASEAPMMMNESPYVSRQELLRLHATGDKQEVSGFKQKIFDKGHEIEVLARPMAEEIVGESLYPVVATDDEGYLLVSYDGLTMAADISWECKQWNEEKAAEVREKRIPKADRWQVVQQLVVGSERVLYMVTDGTPEKCAWMWVTLQPGERETLYAHWRHFDEDVKNYQHVETKSAPVGMTIETLPALRIEATGMITQSNLEQFRAASRMILSGVKEKLATLNTDEDFANAKSAIKWCETVNQKLAAAKENLIAQTPSIDACLKAIDDTMAEVDGIRIGATKRIDDRNKNIRTEILAGGQKRLAEYIQALNTNLGSPLMPTIPADFAGAMKNKKSVATLQGAVDAELVRAKVEADKTAERIAGNLAMIRGVNGGKDWTALFPDLGAICIKPAEDVNAILISRIEQHNRMTGAVETPQPNPAVVATLPTRGRELPFTARYVKEKMVIAFRNRDGSEELMTVEEADHAYAALRTAVLEARTTYGKKATVQLAS